MQDRLQHEVLYDEQQIRYFQKEIDEELRWQTRAKNNMEKNLSNVKVSSVCVTVLALTLFLLAALVFVSTHIRKANGQIVSLNGIAGIQYEQAVITAAAPLAVFICIGIAASVIWLLRSIYYSRGMGGYRTAKYMSYRDIFTVSSKRVEYLNTELTKAVAHCEASKTELKERRNSESLDMKTIDFSELTQAKREILEDKDSTGK